MKYLGSTNVLKNFWDLFLSASPQNVDRISWEGVSLWKFDPKRHINHCSLKIGNQKIAIPICCQEQFFPYIASFSEDFFGSPPIFGLKPPVTCTTSLRFHIGDVFEVWTQGVLDVGGPGNFRFLMVRCDDYPGPFGFYWASELCKKVHPPGKMNESRPWKLTTILDPKWIMEPNHEFSGDILVFTRR